MDPSQVDQVIMNLVVNARDAMENGGSLVVETSNVHLDAAFVRDYPEIEAGPYIQLTVSDTGCGMGAETRQHIFEPFYTTKETGKGTGLGLATVYGIVTQNRGLVLVESELGAGTTFKVFLPSCGEEVREEAEESLPVRQTTSAASILLVEDEESVRQMIRDMLGESGHQVLVAASPQEALELSAKDDQRIDLLLTDVIMPGMNGRELSRLIVQARPGIKVLFMSGYAADILPQEGNDAETHFLKKPFTMQALLAALEERLGGES
jgi:CheY-like chemotaxis protein